MRIRVSICRMCFAVIVANFALIIGGLFSKLDAQVPNNATPGNQNSILTFDHSSLTLVSSGCVRSDSLVRFTVLGSAQQGDSLVGITLTGSPNFQLLSVPSIPSSVGLLDSIGISYTGQTLPHSKPTTDTGKLVLAFVLNGDTYDTTITLLGVNPGPAVSANPLLSFGRVTNGQVLPSLPIRTLSLNAGDTLGVNVQLDSDLPLSANVDSFEVMYSYDDDALTPVSIAALQGWNTVLEQAFAGIVRFRMVRDPLVTISDPLIAAGGVLANVQFRTSLSRATTATIQLAEFDYYLDTAIRGGCGIQAATLADSVSFTLRAQCGNSFLTHQMQQVLPINILSIYPNPSGTTNQTIEVTFNLSTGTHVLVNVTDASGHDVSTLINDNLGTGEHSVGLNSTGIPSGTYFIVVTVDGQREIRKIVVTK